MAKVVLVWNEHPTEVVAGYHARKVAKILRDKYGHEVVIEKIPIAKTNYGILKTNPTSEALLKLEILPGSIEKAKVISRKHNAIVFNFHASDHQAMGNAERLSPREFQLGEVEYKKLKGYPFDYPEIMFIKEGKVSAVEVPGTVVQLPNRLWASQEKKRRSASSESRKVKIDKSEPDHYNLQRDYHTYYMPLKREQQQKYLHPAISEKIAAAIHERVTRK